MNSNYCKKCGCYNIHKDQDWQGLIRVVCLKCGHIEQPKGYQGWPTTEQEERKHCMNCEYAKNVSHWKCTNCIRRTNIGDNWKKAI